MPCSLSLLEGLQPRNISSGGWGDRVGEVAEGQLTSSAWEGRRDSWEQPQTQMP